MSPLEPRKRDLVKCEDMRLHGERAARFVGALSFDEFESDEMVQDAVIRCVEVIGEAARQVSETTRSLAPSVPWVRIVGMRNLLVHDYGGIDLDQVYLVVTESIPALLVELEPLIKKLEREVGWTPEDGPNS